jgi:hypothetical protein
MNRATVVGCLLIVLTAGGVLLSLTHGDSHPIQGTSACERCKQLCAPATMRRCTDPLFAESVCECWWSDVAAPTSVQVAP